MKYVKKVKIALSAAAIIIASSVTQTTAAEEQLNIVFTHHSSVSNTFWRGVKRGFDQACEDYNAKCQMLFTNKEGSIADQVNNIQASIARKPDVIVTAIASDDALCPVIKEAVNRGIVVIASNVDAISGEECGRQSFLGQNFIDAGEVLGTTTVALFPATGSIRVLVGVSAPGQTWSEQRAKGVEMAIEKFKQANPERVVVVDRIDSGTDMAVVAERVTGYFDAHPDLTAYFDMGPWGAAFASSLKSRKIPAKQVLISGFDVVPEVVELMEAGYIQTVVNQGPFLQGYLPVVQAYLMKTHNQPAWSVNTGSGVFDIESAKAALKTFE